MTCSLRGALLHVEGVPGLRLDVGGEAAQDVPDSPGCLKRDRLAGVELGLVPVHLGEGQQLAGELGGAGLAVDGAKGQGHGNVESRISAVERHAAMGVQQVPLVIKAQHGAAQRGVQAVAEQPDGLATKDPEQFQ
jgi:hypothetical protein